MKFKKGDKVKIPTQKTAKGWEGIDTSVNVREAIKQKEKFMCINGWDPEYNAYMVSISNETNSGDFFAEQDLELYEEFVVPEKWYLDVATNDEEAEAIAKFADPLNVQYNGENWKISDSFRYILTIKNGKYGGSHPRSFPPKNFTKLTFEQFKKYILKEETVMENKKAIGYKFKPGFEKFKETTKKIVDINNLEPYADGTLFVCDSYTSNKLKEAGVLDLWFELVYEEEFKVGEYVFVLKDYKSGNGPKDNKVGILTDRRPSPGAAKDGYKYVINFGGNHVTVYEIRKATPEEIKAAQIIKIGEYEVVKDGSGNSLAYKIGCKKIQHEELMGIRNFMTRSNFSETSFDGQKVSLETINRILNL